MAKIKDIQQEEKPKEQTIEEFLGVMDANEKGFFVNIQQPNQNCLDIISTLRPFVEVGVSDTGGKFYSYDSDVVNSASTKILECIELLKLKVEGE